MIPPVMLQNERLGRIKEIVKSDDHVFVLLKIFEISYERSVLGCPRLTTFQEHAFVRCTEILGPVNVQHDCRRRCHMVNGRALQEREMVNAARKEIRHRNDEKNLLNIYCFTTAWIEPFIPVDDQPFNLDEEIEILRNILEQAETPDQNPPVRGIQLEDDFDDDRAYDDRAGDEGSNDEGNGDNFDDFPQRWW